MVIGKVLSKNVSSSKDTNKELDDSTEGQNYLNELFP